MGNGDGIFRFRDGIAIAQIVVFSISFWYALHFRWERKIGWFCIGFFSILRVVGAGCMVGTVKHDSKGLWTGVFVCESLGILLLIFTLLEMMETINKVVHTVHKWTFIIPQILTWIDIGISIGGYVTVAKKESGQLDPTPWSRASTAVMVAIVLYTVGVYVYFWLCRNKFAREEGWIIICVGVCVPLLLVRTAYSLIFVITADRTWNAVKGSPAPYLVMTFLPELAFIVACTFTIRNISPMAVVEQRKQDQKAGEDEQCLRDMA
ncbi:hypothetical protein CC78DRAFT_619441 [Lojkania enalia]|uniref:DUF7702 domain-containing protein n=1 Tax=Lojkania enalia TaxID=147567 RepID=A0A9P4N0H8_9PLEO|nr:hypothetical protein CC78DRAFT_619441 [Didymosphaeria enalia]